MYRQRQPGFFGNPPLAGHRPRTLLQFQDQRLHALPAQGRLSAEDTHQQRGGDPPRLSSADPRSSPARAMERGRSAAISTSPLALRAPCLVAMEACGGSQHWARSLQELGHEVRLLPAKMVRPFVGGNKNDAHDARAMPRTPLGDTNNHHGEAKTWHGLGRAVRRGLDNMKIQRPTSRPRRSNLKRLGVAGRAGNVRPAGRRPR